MGGGVGKSHGPIQPQVVSHQCMICISGVAVLRISVMHFWCCGFRWNLIKCMISLSYLSIREEVVDRMTEGNRLPVRYMTAELSSVQSLMECEVGTADSVILNFDVDMDDALEDATVRRASNVLNSTPASTPILCAPILLIRSSRQFSNCKALCSGQRHRGRGHWVWCAASLTRDRRRS